jgi:hypothetical protein
VALFWGEEELLIVQLRIGKFEAARGSSYKLHYKLP